MASPDLTEAQREAVQILTDYILDPCELLRRCPLDHGRHSVEQATSLGFLDTLPREMHYEIVGHLDVESLLTFRCVNKKAMDTVNTMVEYKKVMDNAPDTIRMAIGIKTAHTFTIKQLFEKLCQKTCDRGCNRPAPYIDVFRLNRTCLEVGGLPACEKNCGLVGIRGVEELFGLGRDEVAVLPSFKPVNGHYGKYWNSVQVGTITRLRQIISWPHYYDFVQVKGLALSLNKAMATTPFTFYPSGALMIDPRWKYTAVFAPWLNESETQAEFGIFCNLCNDQITEETMTYEQEARSEWSPKDETHKYETPNPVLIPFCTVEKLAEHMRQAHGQ